MTRISLIVLDKNRQRIIQIVWKCAYYGEPWSILNSFFTNEKNMNILSKNIERILQHLIEHIRKTENISLYPPNYIDSCIDYIFEISKKEQAIQIRSTFYVDSKKYSDQEWEDLEEITDFIPKQQKEIQQ